MNFELPNQVRPGDYPTCAVCKKPVDELFVTDDPGFMGGKTFTVRCHGQVESVHVTHQDMMAMLGAGQDRVYLTEAFVPKTPQQLEKERRDREDGERVDDFVDSMAVRLLERNPGFR